TCSGTTLTAGPLTAAQTGSIRTCTSPVGTCTAAAAGTCSTTFFTCTGTGICTSGTCTRGLIGLSCAANSDCDFACGNDHDCDMCTAGNVGAHCNTTKGDSAISGHPEYPTSHDCPPPHVGAEIGGLPIPFALTTGTVSKTAFSTGAGNGKSLIFCGLCKDPLGGFQNPPTPPTGCTADSQCTSAPFTSCEQNLNGAFQHADADSITEVGEPAGDL